MTTAKGKGSPFWSVTVTCSCPDAPTWACGKDPANDILCPLQAGAEQSSNRANEQSFVFGNIEPGVVLGEVCKTATIVCDARRDRKSTRLNSSHGYISYAVFCLKKKKREKKQ